MSSSAPSGMNPEIESHSSVETRPVASSLRWLPAAILVVLMPILRLLTYTTEAPSLPLFMVAFMGPAGVAALLMVWWVFASRAKLMEKVIGTVGMGIMLVVAASILHPSMQDMGMMFFVIPAGVAAFAIALILLANHARWRLPVALASAALGFGIWSLIQSSGVSGKFESEFDWRWNATAEERYMKSRATLPSKEVPREISKTPQSTAPVELKSSQWSSFRGKDRDGKLTGVTLSEDWVTNPPKQEWKTLIGPGWSSFVIAGDRLFTQEQRNESEATICLDRNTGETLWAYEYPNRFWESIAGAGPRATPTIADEGLFSFGAAGILVCLDARDGKKIWDRDTKLDSKRKPPTWGFSSSPLVTEGLVIVHAGGTEDRGVLAYDAKTGDLKWSVASGDHSYSSAQRASFDGVSGILMLSNYGLQFLNVADGSTIWEQKDESQNYRTLQPLVIGNSVLLASSLGEGTKRLSVPKNGNDWKIDVLWDSRDMKPDFNDFVEHQGNLYGFDGNIFACIDLATGKRKWKKGRYGNGQVLLLCDAGQMLVASETGQLILLKADNEKMNEVAKIQAIEGKTWNHPVVVGDRIYVRNAAEIACYSLPTQ